MSTKNAVTGQPKTAKTSASLFIQNSDFTEFFRRLYSMLSTGVSAIADVAFPPRCLGCAATIHIADVLCPRCLSDLLPLPMTIDESRQQLSSLTFSSDVKMMYVGYEHEAGGILETCIHALKYQGMHRIGVWLGRLLGERLHGTPLLSGGPLLVPVPLHKVKKRERGYNQAEMLCRGLSAECELEYSAGLLVRRRYTISQSAARLRREQRLGNMLDAFTVNRKYAELFLSKPIVIVDDLLTTGATMGECAAALAVHGFQDIRFLALARPPMKIGTREKNNRRQGKIRA